MRISFAANHGEIGGGEVMLLAMADAARGLGHDVEVVVPSSPASLLEAARASGLRVVEIHATTALAYLRGLRRWAQRASDGLLWCNGLRPAAATVALPNRVVHLHQQPSGKLRTVARVAAQGARLVVVPSDLMSRQVGLGSEVMENWTAPLDPSAAEARTHAGSVVIGYLGRLSPDKGVHVLARAMQQLDEERPGTYKLYLAGEPRFVSDPDIRVVEDALRPIEHLTTRAGWVSREEFFSTVNLAVFPSVWDEPFGLVAAEAMSARCPFVITRAGALPSVAGYGFPWTAEPGDAADLARTIQASLVGYSAAQLDESYRRWAQTYSPEAGRQRLDAILQRLKAQQ